MDWMGSDDNAESPALDLWNERLVAYLNGQEGIEALRARAQPNSPWPEVDNPMVGYLIARAIEIHDEHGLESALAWAIVHSWFESAIDTRADLIRSLGA